MTAVWVLSEESPFDDVEESGGCVCGVFATAADALWTLGTWEIGPDLFAAITWTCLRTGEAYEGWGATGAIYILRRYEPECRDDAALGRPPMVSDAAIAAVLRLEPEERRA